MLVKIVENDKELKQVFAIRIQVFVDEQKIPVEAELDKYEDACKHVLVFYKQKPVGTGRLRIVEGMAKLERICVLADYRKYGVGRLVVQKLEELAHGDGYSKCKLHGQTHAEKFYTNLGYEVCPDIFMEDGIPHKIFLKEI